MKLISARTTLYTLKTLVAKTISDELTNQLALLEAIVTKTEFQEYYYAVLGYYFPLDDDNNPKLSLWVDRVDVGEEEEIPFINVTIAGDENNENGTISDVNTDFSLDIEVYDKNTGEANQNDKIEFITGIIRNILASNLIAGIQHQRVSSRRFFTKGFEDASDVTSGHVIFYLKYQESVFIQNDTVPLELNCTDFRGKWNLKTNTEES